MRPLRLELSGFTAFRDPIVVDFSDVDFFALVGPTGSGKSSIVDALCFALYGCIPRYDDERLIAPAISQGLLEARVRLDFEVGGTSYVAVRVARRQGKGATTKEARLECGEEVLAGNADDVSDTIEKLLGLPFDHFTKCVVLPQGEFARFLHDKPARRQDLLVRLLNFGIYEWMGKRANEIAAEERVHAERLRSELDEDLAFATEAALQDAIQRSVALEELRTLVVASSPKLTELDAALATTSAAASTALGWAELLQALTPPDDLESLGTALVTATESVAAAKKDVATARSSVREAVDACRQLPDRGTLELARQAHERLAKLLSQTKELEATAAQAETESASADGALSDAESQVRDARQAHELALRDERAHDLARTLKKDGPCPVCGQVVAKLPRLKPTAKLDASEKAEKVAEKQADKARRAHLEAAKALAAATKALDEHQKQVREAEAAVKTQPDLIAVLDLLKQLDAAEQRRDAADTEVAKAEDQLATAEHELEDADTLLRALQESFDKQRDSVAQLRPPMPKRQHLTSDWQELSVWAAESVKGQLEAAEGAQEETRELQEARLSIVTDLDSACREAGVEVVDGKHGDAVLTACVGAKQEITRIEQAIATAARLRERLTVAETEFELARTLGRHLSATGFEKWLINEALHRLCEGATSILHQLSDGQYSLDIDDSNNFLVVDHRNADATRSAKTLSGGETFLASLSLALALSEHLSELAASGSARLDAIFLDEGFGTLDPETLEVVASAVESLGAQGRMVGIVTHVRELAERVPVRYEVRKGPQGSTIQRVAS